MSTVPKYAMTYADQKTCTFEGCAKPRRGNTLCTGHAEQRRLGKALTPLRKKVTGTAEERFRAYTIKRGECLIWTGPTSKWGYGVISLTNRTEMAHRYAYSQRHGQIDRSEVIDHICHEKLCVRAEHLQAVSPKQNNENRAGAQANSRSGIRGVCFVPGRGWLAQVGRGAGSFAGYHATAEAAAEAARIHRNRRMTNNLADREARA